jgi:hypothetical protein
MTEPISHNTLMRERERDAVPFQKTTAGSFDCTQDRRFDGGVHDQAVNTFAQDDNSMKVG